MKALSDVPQRFITAKTGGKTKILAYQPRDHVDKSPQRGVGLRHEGAFGNAMGVDRLRARERSTCLRSLFARHAMHAM